MCFAHNETRHIVGRSTGTTGSSVKSGATPDRCAFLNGKVGRYGAHSKPIEIVEIIEAPEDGGEALRFSGDGLPDDEGCFGEGHANDHERRRCADRLRERRLKRRSGGVARTMGVCRRSGEAAWKGVGQEGREERGRWLLSFFEIESSAQTNVKFRLT